MKPYESYKKTNMLWVEEIPGHWEFERITHLFTENKDINADVQETNALQFKFGELIQKKKFELDDELKKTISKYTIVKPFDIMINGLNLNYDFVTQRVGLVKQTGVITSTYISIRPREHIKAEYFALLLKSLDAKKVFNGMGSGIRLTLDYSELKKIQLPVPPSIEQDQIVCFLAWKLSQLNKLIKAKKKQIALLNEQKQAMINKAVTKGLDDSVPMKDSGVGWIGLIPFNWKIEKIKNYFKIQKRIAGKEGYDVLSVTQNGIRIKDISKNEGQMAMNYSGYQFVYPEDFVMNHMDLLTGYVDCSSVFGVTSPDYRVFKLVNSEKCMKEYVLFILQLCYRRKIFYGLGQGAAAQGRWRLPKDNFYNFTFPLPPLNEQQKIVTEINSNVMGIEKVLNAITVELEHIMEYKTALISSVVTGKADVRDVVVPDFEIENEVLEEETVAFNDEIEASEVDE